MTHCAGVGGYIFKIERDNNLRYLDRNIHLLEEHQIVTFYPYDSSAGSAPSVAVEAKWAPEQCAFVVGPLAWEKRCEEVHKQLFSSQPDGGFKTRPYAGVWSD